MDFAKFTAGPNDNGRRIDKVIRILLPDVSLTEIFKAFRKGFIKINNKKVKCDDRVNTNDIISIAYFLLKDTKSSQNDSSEKNFTLPQIIFENEHIIIINKPYNKLVQGSADSLDKELQNYYKNQKKDNSLAFTPGPLHRLDKKTTGLLAFSLSIDGARWFSDNIKNHSIKKNYRAIFQGLIENEVLWDDFIEKEDSTNSINFHKVKVSKKCNTLENGKEAITKVKPLAVGFYNKNPITYCEVEIKTGRMHQIRAQGAFHNTPLLGDTAYGATKINNNSRDFFLHAYELQIPENPINLPNTIICDIPEDFKKFLTETCDIEISKV